MSNTPPFKNPTAPSNHARLSPPRQRLVDLLARVDFGRVLDLHVRGGEPLFEPLPRVVRTVKLSGTPQLRTARPRPDADRRDGLRDLMHLLDRAPDGVIGRIEVAHGVPLFADVNESPAA